MSGQSAPDRGLSPTAPPRFEVVRTDAGFHLRMVGANGEIVLTSEVYESANTGYQAVNLVTAAVRALEAGVQVVEAVDTRLGNWDKAYPPVQP